MMVVPVLITSCQVSENAKNGPDTAHMTTAATQRIKAMGYRLPGPSGSKFREYAIH